MTPDSMPIIDVHPKFANIVVGAGFSGIKSIVINLNLTTEI